MTAVNQRNARRAKTNLQYLDDRRYQRHWLVAPGLPRSCLRIRLDRDDSMPHDINARLQ